jgi:hypothetical protein
MCALEVRNAQERPMDQSHEYDCIVCGAHFENGDDLDRHNHEAHIRTAKGMEVPRNTGARGEGSEESDDVRLG